LKFLIANLKMNGDSRNKKKLTKTGERKMADYIAAHIAIGGKLAGSKLEELSSLIEDLSAEDDWSSPADQQYLQKCSDDRKPLALYDDEARYGEFEELERFCTRNKLTFKRQSSPKYEHEGQIRLFSPDCGDRYIGATDDGEPYLKLSEFKDCQEGGLTLQEVIENIEAYEDGHVPAFELVRDEGRISNDC
jgi:hypothetical protein